MIGADLGGTKICAGLVDPANRIAARETIRVPEHGTPEEVTELVARCIQRCARAGAEMPRAVGIGVAAQVDLAAGSVRHAPNLGWRDFPFAQALGNALSLPVAVENDARAIALGEWQFGAGQDCANFLALCVGTGIGGGAVVDGRLLVGAVHAAGELGHTTLVAGGRPCHCPARGCFEAYVSGWAVGERVREEARRRPAEARGLLESAGGESGLDARQLALAAARGDPFARAFVDQIAEEFAAGVVGLVNAFNPERVILGGAVVTGIPEYARAAQRAVRDHCQPPAAAAQVLLSPLGVDAGLLGASVLARRILGGGTGR